MASRWWGEYFLLAKHTWSHFIVLIGVQELWEPTVNLRDIQETTSATCVTHVPGWPPLMKRFPASLEGMPALRLFLCLIFALYLLLICSFVYIRWNINDAHIIWTDINFPRPIRASRPSRPHLIVSPVRSDKIPDLMCWRRTYRRRWPLQLAHSLRSFTEANTLSPVLWSP